MTSFGQRRVWDSKKEEKAKATIILQNQHGDRPMFKGAIHLDVIFFFGMKSMSKKTQQKKFHTPHQFRPDLYNMIRYLEDMAHGILWEDDCIIASINAQKRYHFKPHTTFRVSQPLTDDLLQILGECV
jgi:Holliday junction resolvase RusA-like endonuclease